VAGFIKPWPTAATTLFVWQRGAGTFDRVGDVYWLTNFVMNGSGQDPATMKWVLPTHFAPCWCAAAWSRNFTWDLPTGDLELSQV